MYLRIGVWRCNILGNKFKPMVNPDDMVSGDSNPRTQEDPGLGNKFPEMPQGMEAMEVMGLSGFKKKLESLPDTGYFYKVEILTASPNDNGPYNQLLEPGERLADYFSADGPAGLYEATPKALDKEGLIRYLDRLGKGALQNLVNGFSVGINVVAWPAHLGNNPYTIEATNPDDIRVVFNVTLVANEP